jgi:hypothetical protein
MYDTGKPEAKMEIPGDPWSQNCDTLSWFIGNLHLKQRGRNNALHEVQGRFCRIVFCVQRRCGRNKDRGAFGLPKVLLRNVSE